jgi:hypothetical protein
MGGRARRQSSSKELNDRRSALPLIRLIRLIRDDPNIL